MGSRGVFCALVPPPAYEGNNLCASFLQLQYNHRQPKRATTRVQVSYKVTMQPPPAQEGNNLGTSFFVNLGHCTHDNHRLRLDWKKVAEAELVLNGCATVKLCQQRVVGNVTFLPAASYHSYVLLVTRVGSNTHRVAFNLHQSISGNFNH